MHLLIAQDTLLSNNASRAQYFVFDQYTQTVFQNKMSTTSIGKVSIAKKIQF